MRSARLVLTYAVATFVAMTTVATAQRGGGDARGGGADNVRAAIETSNKKFSAGAMKKDAAMIASAYTVDAEAFPPNADIVKGRAAIQKMWQDVLASGVTGIDLTTTEVDSAGDLAYEVGTYAMKAQDKVIDRGKYCVVWKRVNGQWLLHRDIWSTNMPAPK